MSLPPVNASLASLFWTAQLWFGKYVSETKLLKDFFGGGTSGFLAASVKGEDQMLIWLPSSQKQEKAEERRVQRPYSFSLEGLLPG